MQEGPLEDRVQIRKIFTFQFVLPLHLERTYRNWLWATSFLYPLFHFLLSSLAAPSHTMVVVVGRLYSLFRLQISENKKTVQSSWLLLCEAPPILFVLCPCTGCNVTLKSESSTFILQWSTEQNGKERLRKSNTEASIQNMVPPCSLQRLAHGSQQESLSRLPQAFAQTPAGQMAVYISRFFNDTVGLPN